MLYHVGMGSVTIPGGKVQGLAMGLGGRAAFTITPHFRIGGMGFNTGFDYETTHLVKGSYVNLKFGGLTVEYMVHIKKLRVSPGALAGGGSVQYLHILGEQHDVKMVLFEKTGTFIFMPYLLTEIPISKSVSVAIMGDWILGTRICDGISYGPRVHVGVLFGR
jgi:hypothetical protein